MEDGAFMQSFLMPMAFGAPGGFEILLTLVVILILFGTKNLPKMARTLGRTLEEFRRAAREVSDEITRADFDEDVDSPSPRSLPETKSKTISRQDAMEEREEPAELDQSKPDTTATKERDEKT